MKVRDLLERGYFPKELPNPFTTTTFASWIADAAKAQKQPPGFLLDLSKKKPKARLTKTASYSHARGGLLRRRLSIPNPVSQFVIAVEIIKHWKDLQPAIGGTALSATAPVFASTGRAITSFRPQSQRRALALRTRQNMRYVLKTDISRFYHSIYAHSIPWAIHTKPTAKANRSPSLLGNRLDIAIRSGQDGQTVGIPIGPDTSLVVAEVLMQACDNALLHKLPALRGHRFIDDYELGFRTRNEAEDAYHLLEQVLSGLELALNPRKTEVVELPCPLDGTWSGDLGTFAFRTTDAGQASDLYRYFSRAFELAQAHRDSAVLQYAIGRLRWLKVRPPNWELFQQLLLACAAPEPACLPFVLEAIISRVNDGAMPSKLEVSDVLNSIIIDHAAVGHSSEVAWALWGALALEVDLDTATTAVLGSTDDSVVAILSLHCQQAGRLAGALDTSLWQQYMTPEALTDENWLLAYEANVKGWLSPPDGVDYVAADPDFGPMKAAGVSFYDLSGAVPTTPTGKTPVPSLPTPPPKAIGGGGY